MALRVGWCTMWSFMSFVVDLTLVVGVWNPRFSSTPRAINCGSSDRCRGGESDEARECVMGDSRVGGSVPLRSAVVVFGSAWEGSGVAWDGGTWVMGGHSWEASDV
ncbi:hypothetical protein M758_4G163600 [Ceratodon purpureus]|nr:hypothetical protein M758_4G163600 [Ceratodon purpureus]